MQIKQVYVCVQTHRYIYQEFCGIWQQLMQDLYPQETQHGRAWGQPLFNVVLSLGTNSCQWAVKWSPNTRCGPTEWRRQKSEFGADEASLPCKWEQYRRDGSEGVKVEVPQITWLWIGLSVHRMRLYNPSRSWQLWGRVKRRL